MSITSGRPRLRRRETEKQASMPLFVKWAQYAPWRGTPFPAHFQENRPLKTPESLKTWAFPVMVLFLSLLFSKVSTMPYGDCSLSKKARRRRTQNRWTRLLRQHPWLLPKRVSFDSPGWESGKGKCANSRRADAMLWPWRSGRRKPAKVSWTFSCRTVQTAVGIPWLIQTICCSRRVGLADTARWRGRMENGAKRLSKPFTGCSSFRAAVSAVIQFLLHNKGRVRFSRVYQSSKSAWGSQEDALRPWPLLLPEMLRPKMLRPEYAFIICQSKPFVNLTFCPV